MLNKLENITSQLNASKNMIHNKMESIAMMQIFKQMEEGEGRN